METLYSIVVGAGPRIVKWHFGGGIGGGTEIVYFIGYVSKWNILIRLNVRDTYDHGVCGGAAPRGELHFSTSLSFSVSKFHSSTIYPPPCHLPRPLQIALLPLHAPHTATHHAPVRVHVPRPPAAAMAIGRKSAPVVSAGKTNQKIQTDMIARKSGGWREDIGTANTMTDIEIETTATGIETGTRGGGSGMRMVIDIEIGMEIDTMTETTTTIAPTGATTTTTQHRESGGEPGAPALPSQTLPPRPPQHPKKRKPRSPKPLRSPPPLNP